MNVSRVNFFFSPCLFLQLLLLPSFVSAEPESGKYKLVWSDEFDKAGKPDPRNWTYERGFLRNHELQWYQPENAWCENGHLIIEGRRERKPNPQYVKGSRNWKKRRSHITYTSACLITKGLHQWQYGRFEVRAKIITQNGLWPAIWFLGVNGEWPSNGEIDLMEFYGGKVHANACWATKKRWDAKWDEASKPVSSFGKNWDQSFHVWRMDWDENFIRLYLDDQLMNEVDLSKTINAATTFGGRQAPKNPFRQPQYLLLNLAIGGKAGGDPSKTVFPSRYVIDYVRVYQRSP